MNALKRTLQYAGLSTLGVGAKLTGNSSLNKALKKKMAVKMAGMRGVPLKVSQILGMSEKDSAEIFKQSQIDLEPMPLSHIENSLSVCAPELLEKGEVLEECNCASLGQVNRFKAEGHDYAVKVQYPDSSENVQMDERALNLITGSFNTFSKGFNMQQYQEMMRAELEQELDYNLEMEMQHEFYRIFADNKDIVIPLSYKKFSSENCLVMDWEYSAPIDEFLKTATEDQCREASNLVTEFYITSIFKYGILHADPNPGNFGFRVFNDRVQLVVYDFGSVIRLERRQHLDLLALLKMTSENKSPLSALLALGFDLDLLTPIQNKMTIIMSILLEPFLSEQKFEYKHWNRKEKISDILGDDRWNFMVAAPADLFLFMRSVYGLFYYTEKLTGTVYCRSRLNRAFAYFKVELQKTVQAFANDFVEENLSENLIISVLDGGVQKVKLRLPAKAVENLSSLIPPEVSEKLTEKNIDTETLIKKVRQNAYQPQEVFELVEGNKKISVYLA